MYNIAFKLVKLNRNLAFNQRRINPILFTIISLIY